jgi:hypothetical protein
MAAAAAATKQKKWRQQEYEQPYVTQDKGGSRV